MPTVETATERVLQTSRGETGLIPEKFYSMLHSLYAFHRHQHGGGDGGGHASYVSKRAALTTAARLTRQNRVRVHTFSALLTL